MFDIEQVQLAFNINNDITSLQISNNILYLSTQYTVYRIDLNHPELVTEFKIVNTDNDWIDNMFLDPKGHHLLVKTSNLNYHYINRDFSQSKILHKLKGFDVSCVAFCFSDIEDDFVRLNNSGSVLVGVSAGIIYELIIDVSAINNDYFNNKIEKLVRQVYKNEFSINGIQIKPLGTDTFNILVSTSSSIILFEKYKIAKYHHKSSNFYQMHKELPETIQARVKHTSNNSKNFCSITSESDLFLINATTFKISKFKIKENETVRATLLTQFHIFILLETRLLTYNQLNNELVSEFKLNANEIFLDLNLDIIEKTFWLLSSSNLYEILIENESKDIWQIMLSQKLYDEALDSLSENDFTSRDLILIKKAEDLFERGNTLDAAKIFSKTSRSTEEVMLLLKNDPSSSLEYLIGKLSKLPKTQLMQRITLGSWILEIYMELLNSIENQINSFNSTTILNSSQERESLSDDTLKDLNSQAEKVSKEFEKFLQQNTKSLHRETAYQIITSHNRKKELLFYANLIKDYDFVLNYYINLGQWKEALKVLLLLFGRNENNEDNLDYIYKYASVLMMNEPKETISTWMKVNDYVALNFNSLLPALTAYNKIVCNSLKATDNETLKLLQYLIEDQQIQDKMIHNTYLCLLASYSYGDGEAQILRYLEKTVGGGFSSSEPKEVLFDIDFILRLCNKYKKIKSLIYIHSISGDYEDAIDLALEHDFIELATVIADRPAKKLDFSFMEEENNEGNRLRKKLWLKIAKKLIRDVLRNDKYLTQTKNEIVFSDASGEPIDINVKNPNVSLCLKYILSKSNNGGGAKLITIQDLLALFPDFMVIDNFKEEIVESLEEYSTNLNKLNEEMTQALKTSVKLKNDLKEYKTNRFLTVEPKESCAICNKLLITRKFFTFPCFHSFHQDCLVNCYKLSKNYKVKNRLYILEKKLVNYKKLNDLEGINDVKAEIDDKLSEKCAYCDLKISEIDDAFILDDDEEF